MLINKSLRARTYTSKNIFEKNFSQCKNGEDILEFPVYDLGRKELSADETEAVLVKVEGQHSAFPISLEFSKQKHEDGNYSGNSQRKIHNCFRRGLSQFPIDKYKQEHEKCSHQKILCYLKVN